VRFVIALYDGVIAQMNGDASVGKARLRRASDLLDDARDVVERRHSHLHDTHRRRLVDKADEVENPNRTFYQYGYLYNADTLCFWRRELIQAQTVLGLANEVAPGCLFP
jgi:hypothetical protein